MIIVVMLLTNLGAQVDLGTALFLPEVQLQQDIFLTFFIAVHEFIKVYIFVLGFHGVDYFCSAFLFASVVLSFIIYLTVGHV